MCVSDGIIRQRFQIDDVRQEAGREDKMVGLFHTLLLCHLVVETCCEILCYCHVIYYVHYATKIVISVCTCVKRRGCTPYVRVFLGLGLVRQEGPELHLQPQGIEITQHPQPVGECVTTSLLHSTPHLTHSSPDIPFHHVSHSSPHHKIKKPRKARTTPINQPTPSSHQSLKLTHAHLPNLTIPALDKKHNTQSHTSLLAPQSKNPTNQIPRYREAKECKCAPETSDM